MIFSIILLLLNVLLAYLYVRSCYRYFKIRKIAYLEPKFPMGSAGDLFLGKKSMIEFQCSLYEKLDRNKILGLFMFLKPTVYVANIGWIEDILVKDFAYFYDRGLKFDTDSEPLTKHLFHLEGDQWRHMRKKVLPWFVAKGVSTLLPRLLDSGLKLRNYVGDVSRRVDDLDLKDIMSRYAADTIGNCAFGYDSQALKLKRTKFYEMSKNIFEPRVRTLLKLILPKIPNFIAEFFDIKMIGTEISDYFCHVMKNEITKRRRCEQKQNDFLDFMLDLQKNSNAGKIPITDEIIMAHCFMFFIAGYENATSVTCIALFELARNPNIQEKLFEEINSYRSTGDLLNMTYKELHNLEYLNMVTSEIIRLYPPATAVIRECAQDYILSGSNLTLNKGLQLVIPVCGIHRDPQYYPYPNTFNPENFSAEAIAARSRFAYIPFGDGLRSCIGRQFGITKIKIALLVLVSVYKFHPSPKMTLPLQFEKKTFITSLKGGAWVRVEERKN